MNLRARCATLLEAGAHGIRLGVSKAIREARLTFDSARWTTAMTWRDRVQAVSWPRASVAAGLAFVAAGSLWLALQPRGIQAHPPRLPTEQEWRANQAAGEAMEAELSPALAAANRPEAPRIP